MLFPHAEMTKEEARHWALDVQTEEEADVLCHRLLRHLPNAKILAAALIDYDIALTAYTGWRLIANLQALNAEASLPPELQAKAQSLLRNADLARPLHHLLMSLEL